MKDSLLQEYDMRVLLKSGTRNMDATRYQAATNVVLLDPEVYEAFRDSKAVNNALRLVIQLRKLGSRKPVTS